MTDEWVDVGAADDFKRTDMERCLLEREIAQASIVRGRAQGVGPIS